MSGQNRLLMYKDKGLGGGTQNEYNTVYSILIFEIYQLEIP